MAPEKGFNVLFLCTRNSARSIMAEVIMNDVGHGRFKGFSAGSYPASAPNPFALETLKRLHFPTDGLYSKDWAEFAKPNAPVMDFVLTVCDSAAGEICPVWPGQPITAHWGVEARRRRWFRDHGRATGRWQCSYQRCWLTASRRAAAFGSSSPSSAPSPVLTSLERLRLERQLKDIGKQ